MNPALFFPVAYYQVVPDIKLERLVTCLCGWNPAINAEINKAIQRLVIADTQDKAVVIIIGIKEITPFGTIDPGG